MCYLLYLFPINELHSWVIISVQAHTKVKMGFCYFLVIFQLQEGLEKIIYNGIVLRLVK